MFILLECHGLVSTCDSIKGLRSFTGCLAVCFCKCMCVCVCARVHTDRNGIGWQRFYRPIEFNYISQIPCENRRVYTRRGTSVFLVPRSCVQRVRRRAAPRILYAHCIYIRTTTTSPSTVPHTRMPL